MGRKQYRKALLPGYKVCPACDTEKPISEFYPRKLGGYETYCKPCKYDKQKNWSKPVALDVLAERFWPRVDKSAGEDGCWLWTGSKNNYGYGQMWTGGQPKTEQVHRLALLLSGVPLPDRKKTGFVVDHACKVILCCNPRHLRIVPHAANVGELADHSRVRERIRIALALGRGELKRKRRPEDDVLPAPSE